MLKYRLLGTNDWEKDVQVLDDDEVHGSVPKIFYLIGTSCQVFEVRLRVPMVSKKDKELKLSNVHFGPENSVSTFDIVDISADDVKVKWTGNGMECASGFQIRFKSIKNKSGILN